MCVCASFPLSLCVCRRKRVYLFCCSTLSLGFAIFACSMYVIFCTILVHRWFRLCLPLFPFRFIFFFFCYWCSFFIHCYLFSLCCFSHFFLRCAITTTVVEKKSHVAKLQLELRFWLHSILRMTGYHTLGPECFASLPNR